MPIDYKKYPSNWKTEIVPAIKERANHCCEFCGIKNYSIGYRDFEDKWNDVECSHEGDAVAEFARELGYKVIKIVLTIAHLDHDINNNDYETLKALCQRCHLRYDKHHHLKNSQKTRKKKRKQIELF